MLIALTGGIGSGKSVVSRILRTWGYEVFDCDSEAKILMDKNESIKARLSCEIAEEVIADGHIDRAKLAEIVFADKAKLELLNSIVHTAVKEEIERRAAAARGRIFFIETAILFASGLNSAVDAEWKIVADEDIRLSRVMERNGMTAEQVRARIKAQSDEEQGTPPFPPRTIILNNPSTPLLPQLQSAVSLLD